MSKVLSGQQKRKGGGKTFESQVRHTSGQKRKRSNNNVTHHSVNKYASLAGVSPKPKPVHPNGWMRDCRCKGAGTCTVCIRERENAENRKVREAEEAARFARIAAEPVPEWRPWRPRFGY